MSRLLHRALHLLRLQPIVVVTDWHGDELRIGAKCATCGEAASGHKSYRNIRKVGTISMRT